METVAPVAKTINLSSGDAVVSEEDGSGTFMLRTKEAKYLFRIPFTVQNNKLEDITKLRNEWMLLIDRYCSLPKAESLTQGNVSDAVCEEAHCLNEGKMEQPICFSLESPTAPEAVTLAHTLQENRPLVSALGQLPGRTAGGKAPPPFPKLSSQPPTSTRTKAFHWEVVPQEKIEKSIWTSCHLGQKTIDVARLHNQFRIQEVVGTHGNEPLLTQQIMLNPKIAHNFNIFLKSFRIKPSQLKEKLYIIHEDSGGLSIEQITALRRYQPTAKDIEMYTSFKGSPSELHLVDQFMLEMCKIPNLCKKLDLLHSIRELPESMAELGPLINQKIRACKQLQDNLRFVAVLEYILAIGNYLNENAGREKAKGFQLSSLAKLSLLRGKERNFTLLHALVEQIFLHEPDLATFPQELTEFKAVSAASIKGLSAEVEVLRKELDSIAECRRLIKPKVIKAGAVESQFYKELKDLIQAYEGDLSQLFRSCQEMKKAYHNILMKFGEAEDRDSEELFAWISTFISDFRRVSAEMIP
ncbi:disheveled-associated activator of morphogenesis 2-like [Podarcis raffonei]|uniref:disheveled-associated activator of morphogenesis 2-like n=1 Tax=Podarcis raffonei TaxID=65483 RepID=UPI0023294F88|nr:disheveled-associated activator of morphogenesis 2-like [Podarcis raffonei]